MTEPNGAVKAALGYLESHFDEFKGVLADLSRIPSVSASGFPREAVRRSADATAEVLERAGVAKSRLTRWTPVMRRMSPLHRL